MTLPPLALHASLRWAALQELLPPSGRLLEIGCGLGAMGARLARRFEYVGVEPDGESRVIAASRLPLVLPALDDVQAGRTFDVVCAFEVLEHIPNDSEALREWVTRLSPLGTVLISVPADPHRWGPGDEFAGHLRRYTEPALERLLLEAGLTDVVIRRYGGPLGPLLKGARDLAARRQLRRAPGEDAESRTAASARFVQPRPWMGPLTLAASAPFRLLQRARPGGSAFVARALLPSKPRAGPRG